MYTHYFSYMTLVKCMLHFGEVKKFDILPLKVTLSRRRQCARLSHFTEERDVAFPAISLNQFYVLIQSALVSLQLNADARSLYQQIRKNTEIRKTPLCLKTKLFRQCYNQRSYQRLHHLRMQKNWTIQHKILS